MAKRSYKKTPVTIETVLNNYFEDAENFEKFQKTNKHNRLLATLKDEKTAKEILDRNKKVSVFKTRGYFNIFTKG